MNSKEETGGKETEKQSDDAYGMLRGKETDKRRQTKGDRQKETDKRRQLKGEARQRGKRRQKTANREKETQTNRGTMETANE